MNLRFDKSLRIRLTAEDFQKLHAGETVAEDYTLWPETKLLIKVTAGPKEEISTSPNRLALQIKSSDLNKLIQPETNQHGLTISGITIQVDRFEIKGLR